MKNKTKQKTTFRLILFLGLFLTFCSNAIQAQSGISLAWDVEVGCQTYSEDPKRKEIFLEDITDGVCLRVCESGKVTYTLIGNLGAAPGTVWNVAGGTITTHTDSSCNITWGASGAGSLTFTLNFPGGIITKTLCFEKIIKPKVFYTSISPSYLGSVTSGQNSNNINIQWNNVNVVTNATITVRIRKCTLDSGTTITKTVVLSPTPYIDIVATPASACSGVPIHFDVVSTNGAPINAGTQVTWNYSFGNTLGPVGTNFTYTNTSAANIGRTVTAVINNANGCGSATNTASVQVTIFPGPSASVSITTGGNSFCLESSINTVLTAATANTATIQWYKDSASLGSSYTSGTLNVAGLGFGEYYFIATNSNNCSTQSNSVFVVQFCPPPGDCVLNPDPQLTNTSYNDCGILHLEGSTDVPTSNQYFTVIGPTTLTNYTASTLNVSAGAYHVFFNAVYSCLGNAVIKQKHKEVVVPYIPKFNYSVVCHDNATFTVSLVDNSDIFDPVFNRTFQYFYRVAVTSGPPNPWIASIATADGTITPDLPPGKYEIRLVIQGELASGLQDPCESIVTMILTAVPVQNIVVGNISCHDTAVGFGVSSPQSGDSYLWTFEPNAESTLASPKRVFSSSGTKTVTVVITNKYGCSRTLTTNLTIPAPCFTGTISSPSTTACLGNPITINYTPVAGNCPVATYTWMNGQNPVPGAPNGPTLLVYAPGSYWVNVKSNLNCSYDTAARIAPTFNIPPSIKLNGPAATCHGEDVEVRATTSATVIRWIVDLVPQSVYNNQTTITLTGLAVGSHTVVATAYSGVPNAADTCWESASQVVEVTPTPDEPTISQEIFCVDQDPAMPYYHVILTATSNVPETFNWSNGMHGSQITVTNGGPYQIRVTSGGCSSKSQVDVPKNLADYIWIFPTGCITQCGRKEEASTLIGPRPPFTFWEWLFNGNTELYGANTFPQPVHLNNSGTYNLALTQGDCSLVSQPLDYVRKSCEKCTVTTIDVKDIKDEEQAYCSYKVTLSINSPNSFPATITVANSNAVIVPSAFTVLSGINNYIFTVFPLGGFAGGPINFQLNGVLPEGQPCINEFSITLPSCVSNNNEAKNTEAKPALPIASVVLAPNPAEDQVTVYYKALTEAAVVELYDLTGRALATYSVKSGDGDLNVATDRYPSGIYIVVVRSASGLISQQKLVLK
jgi:hypothetical protein